MTDTQTENETETVYFYHPANIPLDGMSKEEALSAIDDAFTAAESKGGIDLHLEVDYSDDYYDINIVGRRYMTAADRQAELLRREQIRNAKERQFEALRKELGK